MNTNRVWQRGANEHQHSTTKECQQASTKEHQQIPTRHGTLAKKQQNNRSTNKTQKGSINKEQ